MRWMCLVGLAWMTPAGCKRGPDRAAVQRCEDARMEASTARVLVSTELLIEDRTIEDRGSRFRRWQRVEPRSDGGADAGSSEEQEFHQFLLVAAQEGRAMQAYTEAIAALRDAVSSAGDAGPRATEVIAAVDAVTTSLAALRTQAEAANRAARPVLARNYERQQSAYNTMLEGLARHPENGSPLMDRLSLFETLAETGAALSSDTESLVTTNCALDWSHRPALRDETPGYRRPYRPYGTPSSLTLSEAQIRERLAEIQRRSAEVAEVTQRPAATLLPEAALAPKVSDLRAALARREQSCRGIP